MRVFISTSLAYLLCLNLSFGQNRSIIINEFMYDPTPVMGLPDVEYVELHNTSKNLIFLSGWTLNDHQIPQVSIGPDDFLVLCKLSLAGEFSDSIHVLGMNSWDQLNNTGQKIYLKDDNSNMLDSLVYDHTWISDPTKGDGGWSLELIHPMKFCSGKDNWAVSINANGGTPGFRNSVYSIATDTSAPRILNAECLDAYTIQLIFSETVNFSYINPEVAFNLNPGGIPFETDFKKFSIIQRLVLSTPLDSGRLYNLQVESIPDCENNNIRDTLIQIGIGKEPLFGDVLITELYIDEIPSVGLPESEYIEILNTSGKLLSLKNTYIFSDNILYNLPDRQLHPDSYYILIPGSRAELFYDFNNTISMDKFPRLNNDGKLLAFFNSFNGYLASIQYDKSWYKDSEKSNGGYSLEMIDVLNPCGDINNWTASMADHGGTPCKINSVNTSNPDLSRPGISSAHAFEKDRISIQFNEKLHPGCFKYLSLFVDGQNIQNRWSYDSVFLNKIEVEIPDPSKEKFQYNLRMSGVKDCVGNTLIEDENTIIIHIPAMADSGDIVINEILFNPRPGGTDWIEIYNLSEKFINIKNWYLSNGPIKSEESDFIISDFNYMIEPYTFLVLTKDIDKVIADFPFTKREQSCEMTDFPLLPDSEGFISLWTFDGKKMDELSYNQNQHNLFLKDTEGVSLERVSPNKAAFIPDNWQSASSEYGHGTPTLTNSQYLETADNNLEINISPLVFSPDQDGYDDYLNIFLSSQKPGYVTNIHIFDIGGEKIRSLVKSFLLGTKNNIIWDGFKDDGQIARPGYYILFFELFHPEGNMSFHKRKFVVGRRF